MAAIGPEATICDITFTLYVEKFRRLASYTEAVAPRLGEYPDGISLFVDSNVVLMLAWHEEFLKSLMADGIRHKENEARNYFSAHGHTEEKHQAHTCGLPALISMGRRRVTFKNRGAATERLFTHLFGFSLWPDERTHLYVSDLNILRQLVVHHGGASLGDEYWNQLHEKAIVETRRYGDLPAIRRIDYHYCLTRFMKDIFLALARQAYHVRDELQARSD
jgi:hypothetical protein